MTDNDWVTVFPFTDVEGKEHRIQISERPSGDRTGVRWEYRPEGDTVWRHVWSVTADSGIEIPNEDAIDIIESMDYETLSIDTSALQAYK